MSAAAPVTREDQLAGRGNFMADGKLYLVRCHACGGEYGRENWALAVASGTCAWCGWSDGDA